MDDRALIAAMTRGDPGGLDGAYRRYADRLYAYCAAFLHDRDAAADAVQETFLNAARYAHQVRDPDRLRAWLYSIARRECLRIVRARGRVAPLELAGDVPAATVDPIADVHALEVRELIRSAADGLSDIDREVIELALRHGLAAAEIAAALGISANHAHARLSRARAHLLRSLGAVLLARAAPGHCPQLDGLVRGWNGRLDPLLRKRISRHAEGCPRCDAELSTRLQPVALLTSYAGLPLPAWNWSDPTPAGTSPGGTAPPGPAHVGTGPAGSGPPTSPPRIRPATDDRTGPMTGGATQAAGRSSTNSRSTAERSRRRAAATIAAALLVVSGVGAVVAHLTPARPTAATALTSGHAVDPTTSSAAMAPGDGDPAIAAPSDGSGVPVQPDPSRQPAGSGNGPYAGSNPPSRGSSPGNSPPAGRPGSAPPSGVTPGGPGSALPSAVTPRPSLVTAFTVTARATVTCDRAAGYRLSVTVSGSATLRRVVLHWQATTPSDAPMTVTGRTAAHQVPGLHGSIVWWVRVEAADGRTYTTGRTTATDPC